MTTDDWQTQLDRALATRDTYRYAGGGIGDKTLVAVIAPTAVGKSTIIAEVLRLCAQQKINAAEAGSLTTRARRLGSDPDNYRTADEGVTHQSMTQQIISGQLVNWSASPTGELYGTDAASFAADYTFLPLLPDSLPMMQRAGFQAVHAIYVTIPVDQWAVQLGDRQRDPAYRARLEEAVSSLRFAQSHLAALQFVHNRAVSGATPQPTVAAQALIDIALGRPAAIDTNAASHIDAMLDYAVAQIGHPSGSL